MTKGGAILGPGAGILNRASSGGGGAGGEPPRTGSRQSTRRGVRLGGCAGSSWNLPVSSQGVQILDHFWANSFDVPY
jgi:hypothetical protein